MHQAVQPVCGCGHFAAFEARGLWWHFKLRGWNDSLGAARDRFWCRVCRSRLCRKVSPVRIELVRSTDRDFQLPLPDERELKRACARVR